MSIGGRVGAVRLRTSIVDGAWKSFLVLIATILALTTLASPVSAKTKVRPPARPHAAVPSVPVAPVAAQKAGLRGASGVAKARPVWPSAGQEEAVVASRSRGLVEHDGSIGARPAAKQLRPGGLPVRVATSASSARLRAQVFDRAATERAGVRGVLMGVSSLTASGTAAQYGTLQVSVDYTAFADAYGADWSNRLRLVALPECALTTPSRAECAGTPLRSVNSTATRTVSAAVPAAAGGMTLLSVQSGPSGASGDFKATSLQQSSTWTAGGNSGAFTWSYQMRVPPGVNGPAPNLALSYSSQSVDGRHAATNNQPSWVGEGFEFWPGGFVERRYTACSQDKANGANNSVNTGDQCWVTNNATLSLDGSSGELLYNSTEDRWHLRNDDGSRIERKTGRDNGDNDGEWWVVTTSNGTQYWFGSQKLPGWSSGDPVTNSTWTVPVFGNHSGEPCHAATFASSHCTQAWRWNLDYIVDLNGNTMSLWYSPETNRYARNNTATDAAQYVKGGYLSHIAYGTRQDNGVESVLDANAPAKVVFTTADRCLSGCTQKDAEHWPDTPHDQECTASPCTNVGSPTYWHSKRLATITTQVLDGSSYRDVERWTMTHTFPNPGDGTRAGLWLSKIGHQGLAGGTQSVPDITFTPVSLDNRVDAIDDAPAMAWHRIARIDTETGGAIAVTYSGHDCVAGQPMPELHTNSRRCYPSKWIREGDQDPTLDWFHKYVVTEVRDVDMVGGQPSVTRRYDYLDGAAWHYTDDDGIVQDKYKTWSVFRGYARVGVTTGEGDDVPTYNEYRFFRGMNGDKQPTGTRSASITDSTGGTWLDEDWFAGMTREVATYNGVGGARISTKIHDPWASAATATRTIGTTTINSRFINNATVWSRTTLDGGRPDRVTKVTSTFDGLGHVTQVEDFGVVGVPNDEQCTKTLYEPRNTTAWLMNKSHQVQIFAVDCTIAATPASLVEDQVMSVTRTLYDNHAYLAAPDKGLETASQEASVWNAGSPTFVPSKTTTYDTHGRALQVRDALNRPTTTAYTPAVGGPVTGSSLTNALSHVSTTTIDPAFGLPLSKVDANLKRTDFAYDPLGRLTAVWTPDRDKATETANVAITYDIRNDKVSSVTNQKLNPTGGYVSSHSLYDGLLREVQSQTASPAGGRILTNTFYDSLGRDWETYGAYYNAAPPSTDLVIPVEPFDIPSQTRTLYDGAGREIADVFRPYNVERWRTSTAFGGDRVDVTTPAGGTATSTYSDADGRTIETRYYHGSTPTGGYDATKSHYNPKGQLIGAEDAAGNDWTFTFDLRGRQITQTDPDKGLTRYFYDDADQLTSGIDGRNVRLANTYDEIGRKKAVYYNLPIGTPLARWTYDTAAKGHLDQAIRMVSGNAYVKKVEAYDDLYHPTTVSVVIPSTETGLAGTYSTINTYHVNGALASTTWDDTAGDLPTETLTYEYDNLGLPTRMLSNLNGVNQSYVTSTYHNALGLVEQYDLYTGLYSEQGDAVRLGFDRELETGRLTASWVEKDTAPFTVQDNRYSYDAMGNVRSIKDITANDNQCFDYDGHRRLTAAWTPNDGNCATSASVAGLGGPAQYWLSWTYNSVGNRETQVDHLSSGNVTTNYTYPAAQAVRAHTLSSTTTTGGPSKSWSYDAMGNTTSRPGPTGQQTLAWDAEARLASVTTSGTPTTYLYDADGQRLISKDASGKTLWVGDQEFRYTNASGLTTCTRYYKFDNKTIASRKANGLTWLAADHQGTAGVSIVEQGQQSSVRRQKPFGDSRGSAPAWPNGRGFVGGDTDATGLTHLGAREYDPAIGRFISDDRITDTSDPQQMNGYTYSNSSPVSFSDASGLLLMHDGGGGGGGSGTPSTPKPPSINKPPPPSIGNPKPPVPKRYGPAWNPPCTAWGDATAGCLSLVTDFGQGLHTLQNDTYRWLRDGRAKPPWSFRVYDKLRTGFMTMSMREPMPIRTLGWKVDTYYRQSAFLTKSASHLRYFGKGGGVLSVVGAGFTYHDQVKEGHSHAEAGLAAGASIAGGLAGAWAGAKVGAAIGAFGGPVGAIVGGAVGGLIGGAIGSGLATKAVNSIWGWATGRK